MQNDLEHEKLLAEIEKVRAETESLRHPLSRPSNWLPIMITAAGVITAIGQWQVYNIKQEQAALKAERRLLESEKMLEKKESQMLTHIASIL